MLEESEESFNSNITIELNENASHNVTQDDDDDIIVLDQRPTRNLNKSSTKRTWSESESDDSICEIENKKSKTKEV